LEGVVVTERQRLFLIASQLTALIYAGQASLKPASK
jgi:hypothetical protein